MKYFVNILSDATLQPTKDTEVVGLFKVSTESSYPDWRGEGNFCGWYSREFYKDVLLIAYYVVAKGDTSHIVEIRNSVYFPELQIFSVYREQVLLADSDDEAVAKFFAGDYSETVRDVVPARHNGESVRPTWRMYFKEHDPLDFRSRDEAMKFINDDNIETGYRKVGTPTIVEYIQYFDVTGDFDTD